MEMAQQIKVLDVQTCQLEFNPGIPQWKERNNSQKLSSDLDILVCEYPHQ